MTDSTTQGKRPWEQPFWKPAPGNEKAFIYLVLIHVLAIIGLILYPLPSLKVLGISLVILVLGGLGTTVAYHRVLSHKTLKLNPLIEQFLIFFAVLNGSGHPVSWVAYHRHHHSTADTPDDISSPKQGGFWWAHLRWLYQSAPADKKRWCPELDRGIYKAWDYLEAPVIVLALVIGPLLGQGWMGFFWIGAIRMVYSLHMQCFVNSLTHLGKQEGDSSINVWWLGPLQFGAWGENWHRNHHTYAGSARLGLRWWQPDVGWYFIRTMEAVGLARGVKRPQLR